MKLRNSSLVALAIVATAGLPLNAAAQDAAPTWYGTLHAGANLLDQLDPTVDFGGGIRMPGSMSVQGREHLGLAFGREKDVTRIEVELQGGSYGLKSIALGTFRDIRNGRGHYEALTANVYRMHDLNPSWRLFAGVGAGWGSISMPQAGFSTGCNCFPSSSGDGLALLARAGVDYRLGSTRDAYLQYTWLRLPSASSSATAPRVSYPATDVGAWSLGYRHRF